MKVDISFRHFNATEPLKKYVAEKVTRLDKFTLKLEKAHVVMSVEKFRHITEIVLTGKNIRVTAKDQAQDMYASFDKCFAKMQLQLQRKHDKVRDHKARRYTVKSKTSAAAEKD